MDMGQRVTPYRRFWANSTLFQLLWNHTVSIVDFPWIQIQCTLKGERVSIVIQTGVKPLPVGEEKFRYDTITDAVSDAAAEEHLLLQCPIPTPGQIQLWLLSGTDGKTLLFRNREQKFAVHKPPPTPFHQFPLSCFLSSTL